MYRVTVRQQIGGNNRPDEDNTISSICLTATSSPA
jgi:hypothetical protein